MPGFVYAARRLLLAVPLLLGMSVLTAGLKGLAGSGLRTILSKAAATPLSGAFWGAIVTLIVQSSSATTHLINFNTRWHNLQSFA